MAEEIEQSVKKLSKSNPSMKQDFFTYLPEEMITNILSRLPVQTIMSSKRVSKSWLHLLETDEFVNSHLSKSIPILAVLMIERKSSLFTLYEFEDRLDLEEHDLHYNPLCKFGFRYPVIIQGSANGLLLLYKHESDIHNEDQLYVCNPITRDYIKLHCPKGFGFSHPQVVTFGFGASKITGQLKVVRIFNDSINATYECHIHTFGTESWRSIEPGSQFKYEVLISGVFLNGSLHWLVSDSNGIKRISCFDLEAEHFSNFAAPPLDIKFIVGLSALGDHLCLCDNTIEVVVIWLMKEHGVDNSWTKQYVISVNPDAYGENIYHIYAMKMFGDGDILLFWDDYVLSYYSSKTKTIEDVSIFESHLMNSILLTPSFRSLRSFGIDGVVSF